MKTSALAGQEAKFVNSTVQPISMETLSRYFKIFRQSILTAVLIGVACLSFSSVPVQAVGQDKQEALPCSSETTTAGMRNCENLRFERAQQALDTAYAELMKQLDEAGKAKLRSVQSTWLKFRQADADFEASMAAGGTLAPLIKVTVMADLTEARAVELKKSLQP